MDYNELVLPQNLHCVVSALVDPGQVNMKLQLKGCLMHAAENLKFVEQKLREQKVHVVEPPQTPRRPGSGRLDAPGLPSAIALSMGRAHSANTELAEISIVGSGELPAHIRGRK